MAVWQFQIKVVPKVVAEASSFRPGMMLTEEQRESVAWWGNYSIPPSLLQTVEPVLPPGKTWSNDLEVFGDLEKSCVTIWRERALLVDVHFRFDLREVSSELLETAVRFCQSLQCWLITEDGKVIEPVLSTLKAEMRKSSAFQFVKDPPGFMSRLG